MEKSTVKSAILISIVSLAGLFLAILASNNGINAIKAKSWPTAEGTITASEVIRNSRFIPKVQYAYTIDNQEFTSNRITLTNYDQYKKQDEAAKVTEKYPVNSKVKVYYNPSKFDESTLEPGIKGEHIFMLIMGLVIFIAPLLGLIYTIRKEREGK